MEDDTLFLWGTLVMFFLAMAFILTLRQMFENRLADREERLRRERETVEVAESNSGL